MKKVNGISYLREQAKAYPLPQHEKLLQKVKAHALELCSHALSSMFDGTDDSLFELANHAHTNNEQNRYFEAMRELRIKRKGIETVFAQKLEQLFRQPPFLNKPFSDETNKLHEPLSIESLSLVQNDALEESVALNSMVTKAKANFTGNLLQFQTRVGTLYANANDEYPVNPLDPERICESFASAAGVLAIEIKEKLIVYKQFDRYVIGNLGDILDEANKILVQAGIMPNLKYQARKAKVLPRSSSDDPSSPISTGNNEDSGKDVFGQIQNLLANIRNHTSEGSPLTGRLQAQGSGPVEILSSGELMSLLGHIQIGSPPGNLAEGPVVAMDLRSTLQALLNQESQRTGKVPAVEQIDDDLINLVAMLFEFILDDYNLSAPIQVLISRLQIPILKVAIKDKTFFSKPSHPARRLLNALAKAGIGWSESSEQKRDKLYEHIHRIVQRILTDFNGDVRLFEELYIDFIKASEKEEHKAKLVEKRTQEAEAGRIKSQKAHKTVDDIIRQKLEAHDLPPVARDLLKNGWNRVMFLAYLREDTDHRFKHCVRVVDELIWCLYPHGDVESRQRWVKIVPQLLKQIKAGLAEVSINNDRLDVMINDLKKVLTEVFKQQPQPNAREVQSPDKAVSVSEAEEVSPKPKTAVELQSELEFAVLAEFLSKIEEIDVGTWVEFSLVNGNRFRCKLSTKIEDSETYIFVNRLGLKVVEKSKNDLAHELRKGRLHILDEGMLFDRAMDAVIGNLRKMSGKAA
ncbi:MAG: DUF1631 domain-containing protein [Hahellaceae bacterium]|jgi:hypothetical protein|nr:DUF1631 domain-containing protein [Hahellaceae bacterium]